MNGNKVEVITCNQCRRVFATTDEVYTHFGQEHPRSFITPYVGEVEPSELMNFPEWVVAGLGLLKQNMEYAVSD
ncbi:MAG: hypothetical protein ABII80_03145 [bacterium]